MMWDPSDVRIKPYSIEIGFLFLLKRYQQVWAWSCWQHLKQMNNVPLSPAKFAIYCVHNLALKMWGTCSDKNCCTHGKSAEDGTRKLLWCVLITFLILWRYYDNRCYIQEFPPRGKDGKTTGTRLNIFFFLRHYKILWW